MGASHSCEVNMRWNVILGILLLGACIILAILYGAHIDNVDVTIVDLVAAIGSYFGAREILYGATYNPTPNQP